VDTETGVRYQQGAKNDGELCSINKEVLPEVSRVPAVAAPAAQQLIVPSSSVLTMFLSRDLREKPGKALLQFQHA